MQLSLSFPDISLCQAVTLFLSSRHLYLLMINTFSWALLKWHPLHEALPDIPSCSWELALFYSFTAFTGLCLKALAQLSCLIYWIWQAPKQGMTEKAMATHSSVLAWRIPGTGEPGGRLSMGSHRVGHDWSDLAAAKHGMRPLNIYHMLFTWKFFETHQYILT